MDQSTENKGNPPVSAEKDAEARFRRQADFLRKIHSQEQQLLAFDLHDGLVQDLVAAKMMIAQIAPAEPQDSERLVMVSNLIGNALVESRRLLDGTSPLPVEMSLVEALQRFINRIGGLGKVQIKLKAESALAEFPGDLKQHLYRMIQQAVYNALFHGQPSNLRIDLKVIENSVRVEIIDDGCGFNIEGARVGLGLDSIQARAALFSGKVNIESEPQSGTRISISIPLNVNTENENPSP